MVAAEAEASGTALVSRSPPTSSLGHSLESMKYPVLGMLILRVLSAVEDQWL